MDLSIVTTLFHSEACLREFYERVSKTAQLLSKDYELIFVNDGSPDQSLEIAVAIHQNDSRVIVIDLSRNFGHHQAIMAGLSYAQGLKVFLIDSDLEEQPEWLTSFDEVMHRETCDVVYGQQRQRKGSWLEQFSGFVFYKVFNFLSRTPIPASATSARLMTQRYVKTLLMHKEKELFIPGLWQWAGYHQIAFPVVKGSKGSSTYSMARKITLLVNAITSFSDKPLVYIFYTGTLICVCAGLYIMKLLILKSLWGIPLLGWPSLIVSVWFLGGLTIFFIGVVGIYLSRIFVEIKQRPGSIVRHVYSSSILPKRHDD